MPLHDELPDFNTISASIGELRSDSRRHFESANNILIELKRLTDRLDAVSQLSTELREYRKTLHDRFDRINEIAATQSLALDKLEDRIAAIENDKLIGVDKRITTLEGTWKTQLKLIGVIGSLVLTVGGWFLGTYGTAVLKAMFGGG